MGVIFPKFNDWNNAISAEEGFHYSNETFHIKNEAINYKPTRHKIEKVELFFFQSKVFSIGYVVDIIVRVSKVWNCLAPKQPKLPCVSAFNA